jgi:RNA polymerase-binding transcription factor DksA
MEVFTMSTRPSSFAVKKSFAQSSGGVWHRLHSEREEICETLLKESASGPETPIADRRSMPDAMRNGSWHRALLQARLSKVDSALDRLMGGSYGNCSKCGKWIEDTKLDFDPAIEFCIACWVRMQTEH